MSKYTGKIAILTITTLIAGVLIYAGMPKTKAATHQFGVKTVTCTADATPLDGTTAGREYTFADRVVAQCVELQPETDGVVITAHGAGTSGSAVFNIWGYGKDGAAEMIYASVTGTAGTADYSTTGHFIGTYTGTDVHCAAGGVTISDSGNNRVAKISFGTMGYRFLMFEVTTLATLTDITFEVRRIGYK